MATVSGYRCGGNPARWTSHLDAVLPNPSKVHKKKHFSTLPWNEIGVFMQNLRQRDGMGARALELIILTAAQSGEVLFATGDGYDIEDKA